MATAMPITRAIGKFLLVVVYVAQVILMIGSIGILFTRDSFMPISADIFGAEAPLMNSMWLDILFRPYSAVLVILFAGGFFYFRYKTVTGSHKLVVDIGFTAVLAGWLSILLSALYAPILAGYG